ncbi:MAG: DNA internalization-related competence protein ComEC/Rec2 [Kangiellaceae bacterium]|nr:DNA internalization-related competence protein ComEC/Rec2 [Kangiellaceae bacterium]
MSLISSGILFGLCWVSLFSHWQLAKKTPESINNQQHIIEASIVSLPANYPDYCQFLVKVHDSTSGLLINRTLSLSWYAADCSLELGQVWRFSSRLKAVYGPINQAGFDYERYMFEQAIHGRGYIVNSDDNQLLQSQPIVSLDSLRQHLFQQLDALDNRGIFQALIIGEKMHISTKHKQLFQQLGISHLLAISGLHISIIAGLFLYLSQWLWARLATNNWLKRIAPLQFGIITSCLMASLYAALADFSLPTQRALIMWCVVSFGLLSYQKLAFYQSISIAILLILLIYPLSVLSVSFWMTFIAVWVISLVLMGRKSRNKRKDWVSSCSWILELLKIQIAITISLFIVSLLFFQQASLLGLVVNIILIPLFSFILLPSIFFAVALMLLGMTAPLEWCDELLSYLFNSLSAFDIQQSFLVFNVYLPTFSAILLVIASFLLYLPLSKLKYPWAVVFVLLAVLFWKPFTADFANPPARAPYTVEVFDVGHGLAVLIYNREHAVLYDTGFATEQSSAAYSYLLPSLRRLGVRQLDALILSHSDNDHAGGAQILLQQLAIKQLVAGKWLENSLFYQSGQQAIDCNHELSLNFKGLKLTSLHPNTQERSTEWQGNNSSCVIKAEFDTHSLLLTGDIEKEAEWQLATDNDLYERLRSDVLIVPHHGSNTSSTYPFLKRVAARYAIYATDKYSRYRLPHHKVISRYDDLGIEQWHVGCLGQLTLNMDSLQMTHQRQQKRVWRAQPCY